MNEMLLVPRLAPELNERATNLVIGAVAQHPQMWHGADMLIADRALQEFDGDSSRQTGIGVRELARVNADGPPAAGRINDIHERFGIEYRVNEKQARDYVRFGAIQGIRVVGAAVFSAAADLRLEVPAYLNDDMYPGDSTGPVKSFTFWRRAVNLHNTLAASEELRERVAASIGAQASKVRQGTRAQQAYAKSIQDRHHGK
jgi:hypothetical protein